MNMNEQLTSRLSIYFETNESGEIVCKAGFDPKTRVNIGGTQTSLIRWMYFNAFGVFPTGHIRTRSNTPNSVDPRMMYSTGDLKNLVKGGSNDA